MSNQLSEVLCQKVINITNNYIKDYPVEWENFKKQMKAVRGNLKTKWAEVSGMEGVIIREILQMPETLFTLLKLKLSEVEYLEFSEDRYKKWLAMEFPDMKSAEGRL